MQRIHHFSIQTAKKAFFSTHHGFLIARDNLRARDAALLGLTAVLILALEIEGTSFRRVYLCRRSQPIDPLRFLTQTWRNVRGFGGIPDILKVHPEVDVTFPTLANAICALGAIYCVPSSKDRIFRSRLRYAQEEAYKRTTEFIAQTLRIHREAEFNDFLAQLDGGASVFADTTLPDASGAPSETSDLRVLSVALEVGAEVHDLDAATIPQSFELGQSTIPPQAMKTLYLVESDGLPLLLDYLPVGRKELHRFNAKSAPAQQERQTAKAQGKADPHATPATDEESIDDPPSDGDDEDDSAGDQLYRTIEAARFIVTCWPTPPGTLARSVSLSAQALSWFLARQISLDANIRNRVWGALDLVEDVRPMSPGPAIYIARKRRDAQALYEEASSGGDLRFAHEVLPDSGFADPSWRYLLFCRYGYPEPIAMLFHRGSPAADLLDHGRQSLINLGAAISLPRNLYRKILRISTSLDWSRPDAARAALRRFWKEERSILNLLDQH
ncbi:hypothetical protein [Dongia sp.]|uniref:hypothetical protein n=1 Tax=Dongia sp. TaxID=1977262 RepID=UPI0035B46512